MPLTTPAHIYQGLCRPVETSVEAGVWRVEIEHGPGEFVATLPKA